MRFMIPILAALCLSACFNVPKSVTLPDGSQGLTIGRCRSMNACYNKAAAVCGGKYEVLTSATSTSGSMSVVNGIGAGSSTTGHEIMVKCAAH